MVQETSQLRSLLQTAFASYLRQRLEEEPPENRAGVEARLHEAFHKALANAPPRADVVGDLEARAILAAAFAQVTGKPGQRSGED